MTGFDEEFHRCCTLPGCDAAMQIETLTIKKLPTSVMFISLPVGVPVECSDEVLLSDEPWGLLGRISATTATGGHFFVHVKRDEPGKMPGFYHYDDLTNGGRAVFDEKPINFKANSVYVAYGKK
eukprot:CRZ07510.1 hypothetical protein [Spongospora subterranea]